MVKFSSLLPLALLMLLCATWTAAQSTSSSSASDGSAGLPTSPSDFDTCFCIKSDNTWCYQDDSTPVAHVDVGTFTIAGFDVSWVVERPSCQRFFVNHFIWVVPVLIVALLVAAFPFLFCCARLCCNCCGGRRPSHGCCCPQDYYISAQSGRAIVSTHKDYSRLSVMMTKAVYTLCFIVVAVAGSWIIVTNEHLHHKALESIVSIDDAAAQLESSVAIMTSAAVNLAVNGATFMNTETVQYGLENSNTTFDAALAQVESIFDTARTIEKNHYYGRRITVIWVSGGVLAIALLTFLLMCCNKRGSPISVLMCLFCWMGSLVMVGWVVHATGSEAVHVVCDHLDVVNRTLTNLAIANDYCGDAVTSEAISSGAQAYFQQACKAGVESLCGPRGQFSCPEYAYDVLCTSSGRRWVDAGAWVTLNNELLNVFSQSTISSDPGCSTGGCTISQCAQQCELQSNAAAAQDLTGFMDTYGSSMTALLREFEGVYRDCRGIYNEIKQPRIQDGICGSFQRDLGRISIAAAILQGIVIPMIIVMFLGVKRFTKAVNRPYVLIETTESLSSDIVPRQQADGSVMNARESSASLLAGEIDGPLLRQVQDPHQLPVASIVVPRRLANNGTAPMSEPVEGTVIGGYYLLNEDTSDAPPSLPIQQASAPSHATVVVMMTTAPSVPQQQHQQQRSAGDAETSLLHASSSYGTV